MTVLRIVVLASIAALVMGPCRAALVRARWTDRVPRSAILLWQACGAAVVISLVGICIEAVHLAQARAPARRAVTDFSARTALVVPSGGMTPGQLFALTAALIVATLAFGALFSRMIGHAHTRARQRMLIDLVSVEHPRIPGALVLPSLQATAFSLPGIHSRVVVSAGAIATLADDELDAVLAHERAHVRARHDLVLLPFRALTSLLPASRAVARVRDEVGALVEMAADDQVVKGCGANALARALCRLATAVAPDESLVGIRSSTPRRVERSLRTARGATTLAFGSVLSAGAILVFPVAALLAPIGR